VIFKKREVSVKKKKVKKVLPPEPPKYKIKSAFRQLFFRSGTYAGCLQLALSELKGPRGGKLSVCAECGGSFSQGSMAVDHIEPVVPIGLTVNDMSVKEIYDAVFCKGFENPQDNLQALCKKKKTSTIKLCHDIKSAEERVIRELAKTKDEK
jgi:hypothetical protein